MKKTCAKIMEYQWDCPHCGYTYWHEFVKSGIQKCNKCSKEFEIKQIPANEDLIFKKATIQVDEEELLKTIVESLQMLDNPIVIASMIHENIIENIRFIVSHEIKDSNHKGFSFEKLSKVAEFKMKLTTSNIPGIEWHPDNNERPNL